MVTDLTDGIVNIKYANNQVMEIDTEQLNTIEDMMATVARIAPLKNLGYPSPYTKLVNWDKYVKFDFLTEQEKGAITFQIALAKFIHQLSSETFDFKTAQVIVMAKMLGSDAKIDLSPVDPVKFTIYNKLNRLQGHVVASLSTLLYGRLGYDNTYIYDDSGTVYALKDIRESLQVTL